MNVIFYLFYAILAISAIRLFGQLFLSFVYNLKRKSKVLEDFPKISIIVPAYNEAKTIRSCLRSLENLNYPNYEIIMVDDGSTDSTFEEAAQCRMVKIIRQSNQGKPAALNRGIRESTGEIVVTVDADTILDRDALLSLAQRFVMDKRLGAVAGNVKVKREPRILNALQSAEYATSINLVRKGQSLLGCVMIVPGPIAALKREAVEKAGYFSSDTFAEDFDITVKILEAGYRVEYEEGSLAYTDAPKTVEDLIKQRRRWYRGMIQVLDKHRHMYLNPKYGLAGVIGVPNLWFDVLSPFINIGFLMATMLMWLLVGGFYYSLTGLLIYFSAAIALGIAGLSLEPKPEKRNYLVLPLLLFYNMFLDGIRVMSLTEEMVNIIMEWEKPKR